MTLALNAAAPALQLVARDALNPHFTVQYYANLEVADRDNGGYLEILNTDNGGNNQGGKLPTNAEGSNVPTTHLYLEDVGYGKRKIKTHMELIELYEANQYDYFEAPSLPYVNIFRGNGNYKANEPNTILIEDGTVIRLVADQSTSPYDNAATSSTTLLPGLPSTIISGPTTSGQWMVAPARTVLPAHMVPKATLSDTAATICIRLAMMA